MRIKRFNIIDRLFHIVLIITFLLQTATGFSRLYYTTHWGKWLGGLFGGYEACSVIHHFSGAVMSAGFLIHIIYLVRRINWKAPGKSFLGPDSLVPNVDDFRHLWEKMRWHLGLGKQPELKRWAYWEKFDYWAVFWGIPLLTVTGLMLMYPMFTSSLFPGWTLNIASLLHKAEALLAVSYIFIVHFFIGHLRPTCFPMNEAMFSGSVHLDEARDEKPAWIANLEEEGKLATRTVPESPPWARVVFFIFGYAAIGAGLYMLINGIIYSRYINLH